MRITSQGLLNNILAGLNRNATRLEDYQTRISSGKRVLAPSDDPAAAVKILELRTQMLQGNQYRTNAADGIDWLESTDSVFQELETVLTRLQELGVNAGNVSLNQQGYQALEVELDQVIRNVADLANMTIGGQRIFAGEKVGTDPVVLTETAGRITGASYVGGLGAMQRDITPGMAVKVNVTAQEMLFDSNLLPTMIALRQQLGILGGQPGDQVAARKYVTGDKATGQPGVLDALRASEEMILTTHTDVGARVNRLESAMNRLDSLADGLTKLMSRQEDLDVPKAILELATVESAYKLSLQTGARMVQPTLLDFLR